MGAMLLPIRGGAVCVIDEEDWPLELQRQFIEATSKLAAMAERIERLQGARA